MVLKSITAVIVGCSVCSIALAQSPADEPQALTLTLSQMDQVTAGLQAAVTVGSVATSDFIALTHTQGNALVKAENLGDLPPQFNSYIAVAGGTATALRAGSDTSSATGVATHTVVPGTSVHTFTVTGQYHGHLVDISTATTLQVGSFAGP